MKASCLSGDKVMELLYASKPSTKPRAEHSNLWPSTPEPLSNAGRIHCLCRGSDLSFEEYI